MAVIAEWHDKKWEVSDKKVLALQGLSFSYTQVAETNDSTEDKKTTNHRGTELFPLTFTTTLHAGAGVDIWAEIESWEALVTKVEYFYLGGKKLGPMLQLMKVGVNIDQMDDLGRLRLATLSFEFKEYNEDTTSVKVDTSAIRVKPSAEEKDKKKTQNTAVNNAEKKTIKVGDYVKPTGKYYATTVTKTVTSTNTTPTSSSLPKPSFGLLPGTDTIAKKSTTTTTTTKTYTPEIPAWVKERSHKVSQIKGDKVLLGSPDGINSWVYLSEVTLV